VAAVRRDAEAGSGEAAGDGSGEATVFDRLGELPQVAALVGWTLVKLDRETDSILLSFTARRDFTNPAGHVHGGFITAMLDECMGSAIVGLRDAAFLPVTVSLSADFIAPVPPGTILGEGRITAIHRSSAFTEARLTDTAGTALARATAVYRLRPFPPVATA
jgi:uncharacterized protein (TIGR00369 family)